MEQSKGRRCRSGLRLSHDVVVEILLRLPAKSVARFRCVSTAWLSISTDPSFVLAHARLAPNYLIALSCPLEPPSAQFDEVLFSFSASGISERRLDRRHYTARSSCNGLVLFWGMRRYPFYLLNLLTGLGIEIPGERSAEVRDWIFDCYYHPRAGEHRLLRIRRCRGPVCSHMDASVMSLGACYSWRQIEAKAPLVSINAWNSRVFVNDHLYWTCYDAHKAHPILVFDILEETFGFMKLPSYGRKTFPRFSPGSSLKYGLVDVEGSLCCWAVYRYEGFMENVNIDIWVAVDGEEKWKIAYSLCLIDEQRWALKYPHKAHLLIDRCLCLRGRELLFLFYGRSSGIYSFHWDLKSGKCWTELLPYKIFPTQAIAYKETLVRLRSCHDVRP